MARFPVTIDNTAWSCPQLALHLGCSEARVKSVMDEFHPTTMDGMRDGIRRQLSRPRPTNRPGATSKKWNGYGMDHTLRAKR